MNDIELSNKALKAMQLHEYDIAINNVRRISNKKISTKMELLIIEHEHCQKATPQQGYR